MASVQHVRSVTHVAGLICHPCSRSGPHFPLDSFRRGSPETCRRPAERALEPSARQETRIRLRRPKRVSRPWRPAAHPRGLEKRCLYCGHGTHALSRVAPRRRAAPRLAEHPGAVAARRGRSRRPHRRGRRAPALCPRGLALHVRLLHRACSTSPRPRPTCASRPPAASRKHPVLLAMLRRRAPPPHRHREAGPAPDPGEPETAPGAGGPPVEAPDRGARRRVGAPARCPGAGAEAARAGARGALADEPLDLAADRTPAASLELASETQSATPSRACFGTQSTWPPTPSSVRTESAVRVAPAARSARRSVEPLAPGRYRVQFTASAGLRDKLERLRRSCAPGPRRRPRRGDRGAARRSSNGSRPGASRPPAPRQARRAGRRPPRATSRPPSAGPCRARRRAVPLRRRRAGVHGAPRLEFHHRHPFGHGGDHSPQGIALALQGPQPVTWRRSTTVVRPWPGIGAKVGRALPRSPQPALPIDAPS